MVCFRTDWAGFGLAPAISALNTMLAGFQRDAAGPRRFDACGPNGEAVPAAPPAAR